MLTGNVGDATVGLEFAESLGDIRHTTSTAARSCVLVASFRIGIVNRRSILYRLVFTLVLLDIVDGVEVLANSARIIADVLVALLFQRPTNLRSILIDRLRHLLQE